jgi:hypothetical protein
MYRVEGQEEILNRNRFAAQELSVADDSRRPLPLKQNTSESSGALPPHTPLVTTA